jgi:Flp pilus assembly protein TadG
MSRSGARGVDPRRNQRGAALIEFALVFPLLLILTLTVVDLSRAFFIKNVLYQSAREGARALVVMTSADSLDIRERVIKVAGAANVTVSKVLISGPTEERQLGVTVEAEFRWLFPGLFRWLGANFTNPVRLRGVAWMRKETP